MLRNGNFRRRTWDRAVVAAGLDGLTPHHMRHTAASLAVASGAHVKIIQRMLGYSSAAMTLDTYSDLFDAELDTVAATLDRAAQDAVSRRAATRTRPGATPTVARLASAGTG